MRKLFTLLAMGAMALGMQAQKSYVGNKFFDNWSVGLDLGGVTSVEGSNYVENTSKAWASGKFAKGMRPVFGIELNKKLLPAFSISLQDHAVANWTDSKTMIDYNDLGVLGKININNFFWGYTGVPRLFEVEMYMGAGWRYYANHNCNYVNNAYARKYVTTEGVDGSKPSYTESEELQGGRDNWFTKTGVDFFFNLGEKKDWSIALRPALIWDMDGFSANYHNDSRFAKKNLHVEVSAGVFYNFLSSNGKHHFSIVTPRDQAEVDGLNAQINNLRGQVSDRDAQLDAAGRQIADLQNQLNAERNRKPVIKEVVKQEKNLESIVSFRFDKSCIDASQMPNVARVADYLKHHPEARVMIRGYASPEGTAKYNKGLSERRAASVKRCLIKRYGIAADRIEMAGYGVGHIFSEPSWNRVAINTLIED